MYERKKTRRKWVVVLGRLRPLIKPKISCRVLVIAASLGCMSRGAADESGGEGEGFREKKKSSCVEEKERKADWRIRRRNEGFGVFSPSSPFFVRLMFWKAKKNMVFLQHKVDLYCWKAIRRRFRTCHR